MKQFKSINSCWFSAYVLAFALFVLTFTSNFLGSGGATQSDQNQAQPQTHENDKKPVPKPNPSNSTKREKPPYASCPDSIETLAFAELQAFKFILELWESRNMSLESALRSQVFEDIQDFIQDYESSFPSQENGEKSKKLIHTNLTSDSMKEMAASIAQNPLSVYRLLNRFVRKFPFLSRKAREAGLFNLQKDNKLIVKFMKINLQKVNPPNSTDISDAVRAILQLQTVYNIPTVDLSLGHFPSTDVIQNGAQIKTGISLTSEHCFEIGKVATTKGNAPLTVEWIARAIFLLRLEIKQARKVQKTAGTELLKNLKDFKQAFKKVVKIHNSFFSSQTEKKEEAEGLYLFHSQIDEEILQSVLRGDESLLQKFIYNYKEFSKKEREIRRDHFLKKLGEIEKDWKSQPHVDLTNFIFEEICAGRDFRPLIEKTASFSQNRRGNLFCWYEWKKNPFYFIGPMKMELLSREPDIFRIYNVIGSSLIRHMENEGSGEYIRGTIVDSNKPGDEQGNENTFVDSNKIAMDWSIYNNMSVSWNILFAHGKYLLDFKRGYHKLTKYSNFGIFRPHLDAICQGKFCLNPQERLANYLVYLSDVQSGGQTAFPLLGFGVKPIKGSAIVWYNVFGNGDTDSRTMHGSCPVILGKKFKMTQLVRLYQHFDSYKCPLDQNQRFKVSVNGKTLN